jgi:ABC-type phosphate/phosphonate transport system substrate-binding protein
MLYDRLMIASLPMYDWPEIQEATDAWWRGIARYLGAGPALSRAADYAALWQRPDLLFSQTCGYPFTHALAGQVKLVATPHYACDGCDGPLYRSIILAREARPLAEFRGAAAAVNAPDSMSGMLALKLVFSPLAENGRFFSKAIESGGHLKSMALVRSGAADVCAIDAICVALARRYRPQDLEGLSEIARSPPVPGLPYITIGGDTDKLRLALRSAFADPALQESRDQLFLSGFSASKSEDYGVITELESQMEKSGGLVLL